MRAVRSTRKPRCPRQSPVDRGVGCRPRSADHPRDGLVDTSRAPRSRGGGTRRTARCGRTRGDACMLTGCWGVAAGRARRRASGVCTHMLPACPPPTARIRLGGGIAGDEGGVRVVCHAASGDAWLRYDGLDTAVGRGAARNGGAPPAVVAHRRYGVQRGLDHEVGRSNCWPRKPRMGHGYRTETSSVLIVHCEYDILIP